MLKDKKKGNSDSKDRIHLTQLFIEAFGKHRIECILGDREFIGKDWVDWLHNEDIPYALRIKERGQYISSSRGGMVKAETLFRDLPPGESRFLGKRRICKTGAYRAYVSGLKTPSGEIVVLIHHHSIPDPCERYRARWQIEVLFRTMKTGGFDLEATHITEFDRLHTLLGVVAIACCLAYRIGEFVIEHKKPKLKKHGYKPLNTIRYGLDYLREILRNTLTRRLDPIYKRILYELSSFFRRLMNFVM